MVDNRSCWHRRSVQENTLNVPHWLAKALIMCLRWPPEQVWLYLRIIPRGVVPYSNQVSQTILISFFIILLYHLLQLIHISFSLFMFIYLMTVCFYVFLFFLHFIFFFFSLFIKIPCSLVNCPHSLHFLRFLLFYFLSFFLLILSFMNRKKKQEF